MLLIITVLLYYIGKKRKQPYFGGNKRNKIDNDFKYLIHLKRQPILILNQLPVFYFSFLASSSDSCSVSTKWNGLISFFEIIFYFFDTTLVTVYPFFHHTDWIRSHISIQLLLLFIKEGKQTKRRATNFNTTLVTVYQTSIKNGSIVDTYFNTTLVTVYRNCPLNHNLFVFISIQLLLLFIFSAYPD